MRKAVESGNERRRSGDVVVIAGKGHETYQVLRDRTIHFSDTEVATEALNRLGYRQGERADVKLSLEYVARSAGADPAGRSGDVSGYSIDSRTLRPGDLFIAINGEHHDGHQFVPGRAQARRRSRPCA